MNGRLHPITVAVREITDIFGKMGFGVAYGPELEDEWHNFSALNVPADHPARDMQDTFWIKERDGHVLRTHTTFCDNSLLRRNGGYRENRIT